MDILCIILLSVIVFRGAIKAQQISEYSGLMYAIGIEARKTMGVTIILTVKPLMKSVLRSFSIKRCILDA
jgi:hypothetical protein